MLEGTAHPDRNDQFEYLNDRVDAFQGGAPVISVDTKKKELVGDVYAVNPATGALTPLPGVSGLPAAIDGIAVR